MENLNQIKKKLEKIAGIWNGDDSGIQEERAMAANEGLECITTLENILSELGI